MKDERGIALITALVLAMISMAIATTTWYMVLKGTEISGIEKRFTSALGAAKGGLQIAAKVIGSEGTDPTGGLVTVNDPTCFNKKIENMKIDWSPECSASQQNPYVTDSPDLTITLGSYRVLVKIISTTLGTTELGGITETGPRGVVAPYNMVRALTDPRLYRLEVRSESTTNPLDTAELTALYAY